MFGHLLALFVATAGSLVVGTPIPLVAIGLSIGVALCLDRVSSRTRSTTH